MKKTTDSEIFKEWLNNSLAKYIVKSNAQMGFIIEFAKFYHEFKTRKK